MFNNTIFWLCCFFFSFMLLTARDGFPYAVPAYDPVIAADDYYSVRPQLRVIEGGKINPEPVKIASSAGFSATLGLVAASTGIVDASFYLATGKSPAMVLQAAAASALDHVILPGYQAFQAQFVSPDTFPVAGSQYVGQDAGIGVAVGDFVDYVKGAVGSAYDSLKAAITANTSTPIYNPLVIGDVIPTYYGTRIISGSAWTRTASYLNPYHINYLNNTATSGYRNTGLTDGNGVMYYTNNTGTKLYRWPMAQESYEPGYGWYCRMDEIAITPTGLPPVQPIPGAINYPALAPALQDWLTQNPEAAADAVRNIDPAKVGVTSQPVPTTNPSPVTPAINPQQVANFYQNNVSNVANTTINNITENSTAPQIAQGQAAIEAAKAQAVENQNISMTGDATLPPSNTYDSTYENPEELDFVDTVHQFLNSGLPVLSSIKNSSLTSSGSPSMSTTIWGNPVSVDFSDWAGVLRTAGVLLVSLSSVLAFRIVIGS